MNENLFTFPRRTADASGDNPFDLSGFTELTSSNTQNPFADLLAGGGDRTTSGRAPALCGQMAQSRKRRQKQTRITRPWKRMSPMRFQSPAPQDPQPKSPPAPKSEEDQVPR